MNAAIGSLDTSIARTRTWHLMTMPERKKD